MTNLCYVSDACLLSFIWRWLVAAVWLVATVFATRVLLDSFALANLLRLIVRYRYCGAYICYSFNSCIWSIGAFDI